jgi:hypothetical protein
MIFEGDSNWKKWWPGNSTVEANDKTKYSYSGYDFHVDKILYQAYELLLSEKKEDHSALMTIILVTNDSTRMSLLPK